MKKAIQLIIIIFPFCVFSQKSDISKVNLGFGLGVDYGGIGGRLTVTPSKNFGIFGAVGYAIAGVGLNGGIQGIFNSNKRAVPYLTAMYGYNAALYVSGAVEKKKLYYGPSFGIGLKLTSRRNERNFLNLELLIPVRDPAFKSDMNYYQNNYGVSFTEPLPVSISVCYHIGF